MRTGFPDAGMKRGPDREFGSELESGLNLVGGFHRWKSAVNPWFGSGGEEAAAGVVEEGVAGAVEEGGAGGAGGREREGPALLDLAGTRRLALVPAGFFTTQLPIVRVKLSPSAP